MTISIANLEFFFKKHPEFTHRKEQIMAAAHKKAENGILVAGVVDKILGDLSELFFTEVHSDPEHAKLWFEELQGEIVESPILGIPGGEIVVIPQDKALESDFLKSMHKFQYGETKEESDEGFEEMKKSAQEAKTEEE